MIVWFYCLVFILIYIFTFRCNSVWIVSIPSYILHAYFRMHLVGIVECAVISSVQLMFVQSCCLNVVVRTLQQTNDSTHYSLKRVY
jgi:hypothetical protein